MSSPLRKLAPPGLAVIANSAPPYTIHLHRRIAREIPELKLLSIFTRAEGSGRWVETAPPEINPVVLAKKSEHVFRSRIDRPIKDFRKGLEMIRMCRDNNVRVAIINGYDDLAYLPLFALLPSAGIPVFLRGDSNSRGRQAQGARALIKQGYIRAILRRCSGVMPMGRLGMEYFSGYGVKASQMFMVPYEPDYAYFNSANESEVLALRASLGLSAAKKYLIFCGRLVPVKRLDLLIDAFVEIQSQRLDWELLIAGEGELEAAIKSRIAPGVRERIHWLGFHQSETMRVLFKSAHLLVVPSENEPWGLVINEAMAAGLPVIASHVVGSAFELVQDGVCGKIFRTGEMWALKTALLEATEENVYQKLRSAVPAALAAWRSRADPVVGVRNALASVGLVV